MITYLRTKISRSCENLRIHIKTNKKCACLTLNFSANSQTRYFVFREQYKVLNTERGINYINMMGHLICNVCPRTVYSAPI